MNDKLWDQYKQLNDIWWRLYQNHGQMPTDQQAQQIGKTQQLLIALTRKV